MTDDRQDEQHTAVYYRRLRPDSPTGPVPDPEVSPTDRMLDAMLAGEVDAVIAIDRETDEPRVFPVSPPRDSR
ncbi:hypothetical protein ABT299_11825 [Spirillospora sp. NPDC000708]